MSFLRRRRRDEPETPKLPEYVLNAIGRSYLMVRGGYDDEEHGGNRIVLNAPVNPFVFTDERRLESILSRLYPELSAAQLELGGRRWARHLSTSHEPVNNMNEYFDRKQKRPNFAYPYWRP